MISRIRPVRRNRARGAVLVEFAIASFVFIIVSVSIIELMRAFLTAQVVGEASRIVARQVATTPGPISTIKSNVYLDDYSVIDLGDFFLPDGTEIVNSTDLTADLNRLFTQLPPVHSALRSVMILDDQSFSSEADTRRLLRFPGTLFQKLDSGLPRGKQLFVRVPILKSQTASTDVLEMHKPVEIMAGTGANGNVVFPSVFYHFQFSALIPVDGSGNAETPIDPSETVITFKTIDDLSSPPTTPGTQDFNLSDTNAYRVVNSDYDLGRMGGLHNKFVRNLTIPITVQTAARKEVP